MAETAADRELLSAFCVPPSSCLKAVGESGAASASSPSRLE